MVKLEVVKVVAAKNNLTNQQALSLLNRRNLSLCRQCKNRTVQMYTHSDGIEFICEYCDWTSENEVNTQGRLSDPTWCK